MSGQQEAVTAVVRQLLERGRERSVSITWLNHWSAQRLLGQQESLRDIDLIGIDGVFLLRLVASEVARTSADLVMPAYIRAAPHPRILHIGGRPDVVPRAAAALADFAGSDAAVVKSLAGYGPDASLDRFLDAVRTHEPTLVLVGMGAGLQEQFASAAAAVMPAGVAATCGGWLDQVAQGNYYPSWAYPLKLNWAVRLAREPSRLWRRYTVDAARAWRQRDELRGLMTTVGERLVPDLPR